MEPITVNSRIFMKTDTTENWSRTYGFRPFKGEIIIYSDYDSFLDASGKTVQVPGIKVGDGNAYVQDLPFTTDGVAYLIRQHIIDDQRHVSEEDRYFWNNKSSSYIVSLDEGDNSLILTRDHIIFD